MVRQAWAVAAAGLLALTAAIAPTPPTARPAGAQTAGFDAWLEGFRRQARQAGISEATLGAALTSLAPIPRVIELDRHQPEVVMTLARYVERVVSDSRVETGRARLAEHRALLERVGERYGVDPPFLVALWGVESNFGQTMGSYPVVAALATLAWDGRRRDFFQRELLEALRIIDAGHVRPEQMMGSWAGAMGQPQFMPSSFRRFAVDGDGDGRVDIWGSHEDILASAANYLARAGWKRGQAWGREVSVPRGLDRGAIGPPRRWDEWEALGVRATGGEAPPPDGAVSLVQPDGPGTRAFAVSDNYRVLLRWNRSDLFAIAVGLLADRIDGRAGLPAAPAPGPPGRPTR